MLQKTTDQRVLLVNLLVLLLIAASLLAGCGGSAPDPLDRTAVSEPSATSLVVADFDSCTGTNNLGGQMGGAYDPPDILTESYQQEPNRGCVAKLEYKITHWAAFWLKLKGADVRGFRQLQFDVRADPQPGIPRQIKLELKRVGEVSIKYVSGIGTEWKTISVELSDFGPAGYDRPVSSWQSLEELVFTFEANKSGGEGVVYLDRIVFAP